MLFLDFFFIKKHEFRGRQLRNFFKKWKQKKYTQNTSKWNVEFSIPWKCLFTKMTCDNWYIQFQIYCTIREFLVYRNIWSPKIGENLVVRQEVGNDNDRFAMSVGANIPEKIMTNFDIAGHIPREISRFCYYFVNYRWFIEAAV